MEAIKPRRKGRLWFDCAELLIALCVPLTIIVYTVMHNSTEITIAQQNRLQDLQIAAERYQQDVIMSNDQQEETTLVRYFDALGKLLEKNEKLINQTNIARFKTLSALAQLSSKRKGFLIRSLIENDLIRMTNGGDAILDLSLADLTGLNLTNNMLVNNIIQCVIFSETTLTNSSFRGMTIRGAFFINALLANSDFSLTHTDPWSCGDGNRVGVNFNGAILDGSIFDDVKYESSIFTGASLDGVRMHRFKCADCKFFEAKMTSMDISYAEFLRDSATLATLQKVNMSWTRLYKTNFIEPDFRQSILPMLNASETIFNTSHFSWACLDDSYFNRVLINNSWFLSASLKGSTWTNVKISHTNFEKADMSYMTFIHSECHYCIFNQTQMIGMNFTNSSLDGSDFTDSDVTVKQLMTARSLDGVILPDGTMFQTV